jgi:hypothetical protein
VRLSWSGHGHAVGRPWLEDDAVEE